MGKISKNANIYDLQGNCLRHVDENGKLHNYTTEELEELVDKLANDKDENGKVKDPQALNNANSILFQYYQKYGNPHENELKELIKKYQESKTTEEEAKEKLNELASDIASTGGYNSSTNASNDEIIMDKYIDYEEIPA